MRPALWLTAALLAIGPAGAHGAAGDIDPKFSRDGFAPLREPSATPFTQDVSVDTRGRIVVVAMDQARGGPMIGRLRPNGKPDRSFGRRGVVTERLPANIFTAATDSRDRIVVGGSLQGEALIMRFLASGDVDRSFGANGFAHLDLGTTYSAAEDLSVIGGDAIAIAGTSGSELIVAKLTASGRPSADFAGDGVFAEPLAPGFGARGARLAALPDGGVLVAAAGELGLGALRLTAAGTRAPDFGTNGAATIVHDEAFGRYNLSDVALDEGSRLLVAGNECTGGRSSRCRAAVARVDAFGRLDTSFASGGWWTDTPASISGVAVRGSKVILSATVGPAIGKAEGENLGVFRLSARGERDASFSSDGKVGIDFRLTHERSSGVAVAERGRIVVAGNVRGSLGGDTRILVARFRASGGGKPNADGDRYPDKADRCPYGFAANRTGCPRIGREAAIKVASNGRVRIVVKSRAEACTEDVRVMLMRAVPGRDELVARGRTLFLGTWTTDARPSRRLYARAPAKRVPKLAVCDAAVTGRLRAGSGPGHRR